MAKYLYQRVDLWKLTEEKRELLRIILDQVEVIIRSNLNNPSGGERYSFLIKKSSVFSSLGIVDSNEQLRCKDLVLSFINKLPFSMKDEDNPKVIMRDNLILDIDWCDSEEFFKVKIHPDMHDCYISLISSYEW